jgi:hypothetical protein
MKKELRKINYRFAKRLFSATTSKDIERKLIPLGFSWFEVLYMWVFPTKVPLNRLSFALEKLGLTEILFEMSLAVGEFQIQRMRRKTTLDTIQ